MTVRLSLGRPGIHLTAGRNGRPILGGMRRPAPGRRGPGIPEAGRRRAGVPQT